jgi:hypothetical protein
VNNPRSQRDSEPVSVWLGYNLGILWALILLVAYAVALSEGPADLSWGLYVLLSFLSAFFFGGYVALLASAGGLLYLVLLARFRTRWTKTRRRLLAVALSPLVGVPWWFLTLTDYGYDRSVWIFMGGFCLVYGLVVRFPPDRDGQSPLRREATVST